MTNAAHTMFAADEASRALSIELVEAREGRAVATMTITRAMVNGHDVCHGGYIFALADSAMAFASNTYNQRTLAQHCSIAFVASAQRGDRLVARATERMRAGRSGIYDVTVTREEGFVIAEFRGHTRAVEGEIVPGLKPRAASLAGGSAS